MSVDSLIDAALSEDIGAGDHTSLACIDPASSGEAFTLVKQEGVIAGLHVAQRVFLKVDDGLRVTLSKNDGDRVAPGDRVMHVMGKQLSILSAERTALNFIQRMSGIATLTARYVKAIEGTKARLLDTRKTTPGWRELEKEAVRLGGGFNHRMGLHDMILIKDNHIAFCGGITKAIELVRTYLDIHHLDLRIEVETRNMDDVRQVISSGSVDRIMLDNFNMEQLGEAVSQICGQMETEASGGITLENVRQIADTGIDYISVGAITHSAPALDVSLEVVAV